MLKTLLEDFQCFITHSFSEAVLNNIEVKSNKLKISASKTTLTMIPFALLLLVMETTTKTTNLWLSY